MALASQKPRLFFLQKNALLQDGFLGSRFVLEGASAGT
jgi:hypothetical protein